MNIVTDIFLPFALAFIMFALGLGLTGVDFLRVIKQPKDFFVGAISQVLLLPIIAFVLVKLWPISPELAIGVMIIAAAPGGVTSNILTSFARGDVALSISLTAIISLFSVITVPFIVVSSLNLLGLENISKDISLLSMALKMFLIVTVPVILGILLRKFASNFAVNFESTAKKTDCEAMSESKPNSTSKCVFLFCPWDKLNTIRRPLCVAGAEIENLN